MVILLMIKVVKHYLWKGEFKIIALNLILKNIDQIEDIFIKIQPELNKLISHR